MAVSTRDPSVIPASEPISNPLLKEWQERRENAHTDRRRYEPAWHMARAFLAGRQWVGWNKRTRRVVSMPNPGDRERHTINVITQYHQTVLGKLYVEDLRPDLLFTREDSEAQGVTEHAKAVAKYAWETEVQADKALFRVLHKMITYGTAGLRCMFDPSQGPVIGEVPVIDGEPVYDMAMAREIVAQAQANGQVVTIEPVREGRTVWEPLSPFQMLTPPGVEDSDFFPWLIIERAMAVEQALLRFPAAPEDLAAQDLEVSDSMPRDVPTVSSEDPVGSSKLKNHVLVATGYQMPTKDFPDGRIVHWTGNHILESRDRLPYTLRGKPHHGITFFHYHAIDGRFWAQGVCEPLIGPQRQLNRSASQRIELKDRNLGRVYARKGTITASNQPTGKIMELIEVPLHSDYPQEVAGGGIGPWVENEHHINMDDMDRVAGLREVSLGTTPAGVTAFSAMALLAEQDERRVGPVLKAVRGSIADSLLLTLELARKYWPDGKHLAVAGPEGRIETFQYRAAQLPDEFFFDISKASPLPTSPAIESQKIFDLFHAAIAAGAPLPPEWLKDSLDQGRALPFPKREEMVQQRNAEYENYLIEQGQMVAPKYFDDDYIHVQVHRHAQMNQASTPGTEQLAQALEMHIIMHMEQLKLKKPLSGGASSSLPAMQGGAGIQAQSGALNLQGLAANINGPAPASQGGAARGSSSRPGA